jgi:hypothetical protein
MFLKKFLATASFLSCVSIANAAQTTVAFLGGSTMYQWADTGIFGGSAAYKWESYGFKIFGPNSPCLESDEALQSLQSIITSGQKPVIHLMVGAGDSETDSTYSAAEQLQSFEGCFAKLITTAQNAKLKILVGTNPVPSSPSIDPYNKFIFAYSTARGIPVIDYYTLLARANENFEGIQYETDPVVLSEQGSSSGPAATITSNGYAIMNALADRAIAQYVGGVTLKGGYLGNDYQQNTSSTPESGIGGNTVAPGTQMHWQAWGQYSDGITQPIANANVLGQYGTWTSSNPAVISVDQFGNGWALGTGSANIHFTTLSGVTLNEWIMYVDAVPVP